MNKLKNILSMLLIFLLAACSKIEQEELFNRSSSERVEASENKYRTILENSEYGWDFQYFARDIKKYGGVNYYLTFKDGYVTAQKNGKVDTSIYTLLKSTGVVLSFNLDNKVLLEIANKRAVDPLGFKVDVDYEFTIISATEKEIVLQGLRSGQISKLVKLEYDDYEKETSEIAKLLKGKMLKTDSNFKAVELTNYNSIICQYGNEKKDVNNLHGFIISDKGIKFYKPFMINNVKVSELILDKSENVLKTEDESVMLEILTPPFNLNTESWYFTLKENEVCPDAVALYPDMNRITKEKFVPKYLKYIDLDEKIFIGYNRSNKDYGLLFNNYGDISKNNSIPAEYKLDFNSYQIDDELYLSITKRADGKNFPLFSHYSSLVNILVTNKPYKVEMLKGGTQAKIVSVSDPSIWFILNKK